MHYDKVNEESKKVFWEMVEKAERVIITSHMNPDDDSISSTMSLYFAIGKRFPEKELKIVYTGNKENRYDSFILYEQIEFVADVADVVSPDDLVILLDAGTWSRASKKPEVFEKITQTICIDHHGSIPGEFNLRIIDKTSPCCAELIYKIIEGIEIETTLAESLLLGILGDTGNFVYLKPSQTETFLIAKQLVEKGNITIQEFQSRYRYISETALNIMREFMKNFTNMEIEGWKPFSYSFVTREFVESHKYSEDDIAAAKNIFISQYIRLVENHPWGFVISPKNSGEENYCSISLRSLPQGENVREISERMGAGGGHDLAAGGAFKDESDPEKAIDRVIDFLKSNPPTL